LERHGYLGASLRLFAWSGKFQGAYPAGKEDLFLKREERTLGSIGKGGSNTKRKDGVSVV